MNLFDRQFKGCFLVATLDREPRRDGRRVSRAGEQETESRRETSIARRIVRVVEDQPFLTVLLFFYFLVSTLYPGFPPESAPWESNHDFLHFVILSRDTSAAVPIR